MFEIRPGRAAQGRRQLLAERHRYFELVEQGYSSAEACRIVGVNEKTGREWRNGRSRRTRDGDKPRTHPSLAPVRRRAISARFLSQDERVVIADMLQQRRSIRSIAAELGRAPSSISREIRRNKSPKSYYAPFAAHMRADLRKSRPKAGKIGASPELAGFIQERLERRWSPEQIASALRQEFPTRPEMRVVHETIYQALYSHRGGLRRELTRNLRRGRPRRKRRRHPDARQRQFVAPMVLIRHRPAEADGRLVGGHWEGDLITGANNSTAIGTLVERRSRFLKLVHLPLRHDAVSVRDGLITALAPLPPGLRRTLTWDQGKELARHQEVTEATGMAVFFCDPASPWQRGSNENTNGLLRQYFPKGTSLTHPLEQLQAVADEINSRPRKILGWATPADVFDELALDISR